MKTDLHLDGRNQLSFKVQLQLVRAAQRHLDVDSWGLSANGVETDEAPRLQRELAVAAQQYAVPRAAPAVGARGPGALVRRSPSCRKRRCPRRRSSRPWAAGPSRTSAWISPTASASGCPSSSPIDPAYDTRLQVVDNWSWLRDRHLFKAGAEYNRTGVSQQFIGFANGRYIFDSVDGFINFRDAGERLRDLLGRLRQRERPVPGGDEHHRSGADLPAVGDGAGGGAGAAGRGRLRRERIGVLRAGHLAAERRADAEPGSPLGGDLAPGCRGPAGGYPSTPPT